MWFVRFDSYMCFSAEASFISAALLGAAGLYLGNKFWKDRRFLIAITPFMFAIQQAAEGFLWLGLDGGAYPTAWAFFAQYTYLFFAYLFWPIWIPSIALNAEVGSRRRKWLKFVLLVGVLVAMFNGFYLFTTFPIQAQVVHHSISYGSKGSMLAFVYGFSVVAPFFISSLKGLKIVGALIALSFLIALFAYTYAFTSIWCFVAVLTTLLFLITLKR